MVFVKKRHNSNISVLKKDITKIVEEPLKPTEKPVVKIIEKPVEFQNEKPVVLHEVTVNEPITKLKRRSQKDSLVDTSLLLTF